MLNYVGGRCVCAIETVHCTHICSFPAVVDADSLAGRSWLISSSTHKPISCRILQTYISSQKEILVKNKVFGISLWTSRESCPKVQLWCRQDGGGKGIDMKLYWNQKALILAEELIVHFRVYTSNIK